MTLLQFHRYKLAGEREGGGVLIVFGHCADLRIPADSNENVSCQNNCYDTRSGHTALVSGFVQNCFLLNHPTLSFSSCTRNEICNQPTNNSPQVSLLSIKTSLIIMSIRRSRRGAKLTYKAGDKVEVSCSKDELCYFLLISLSTILQWHESLRTLKRLHLYSFFSVILSSIRLIDIQQSFSCSV